jgi:WD40 repeat protein
MNVAILERPADTRFVRHRGPVTCAAGVPHTRQVVTSGYDGAVGLFDLETGETSLLGYHRHLVNRVIVDQTGKLAATPSSDYTIGIWDLTTRRLLKTLKGHSDDVEDFAFVDDRIGASVSRDWRVLVWDLQTGAILRVLEGHEKDALSVVYCDGRLYTSGDDSTLRVWDLETGALLHTWGPFSTETDTCAIDPLHGRAVLGCDDGCLRIFSIRNGDSVAEIPAHSSGIKKVAVSPVTGDILSAAYDQRILLWGATDLRRKTSLDVQRATWERSFNWSPDGNSILAGTFDGTVLEWDPRTGECRGEFGGGSWQGNACLNEVAADSNGELVVVSDDGIVRCGRLSEDGGEWLGSAIPPAGRILMNAVTLDAAAGTVVCGAHNGKLHMFKCTAGCLENGIEITLGQGPINSVRISRHPQFDQDVFVACYSGAVARVSREGVVHGAFHPHGGAVKALRLHPGEPLGVSCSADGTVASWDFGGTIRERFLGHMAIVDDVDLDPTGKFLASTGRDFTVKVYRLEGAQLCHSVCLGRRSPKSICFWDAETVLVGNYWGELLKVDLLTGGVTRRQIAQNGISSLARMGKHVVAVSYDGGAYLIAPADLSVRRTLRAMTQRCTEDSLVR